ncbi:hypothetical protein PKB_5053 [Pseudomonas knackmussii B13]|uniref:Uncharacterized protein n=1 Tax=Pseudomonas knackmussii (strain DSM 6978 / CCUG 54928 / LMG 23759 / B13) TaxID=1301098 RepID=A0A024HNA9_PSEKB|nr:Lar family restriction alleviation protein [Pseudomonas knackmussii]CDF86366.1 hypothetical protein PKB_5053 [Pseudomonas knackmussii B13]
MNAVTIVLRSGMGMHLDAVRPYLNPGMPIAIGRAGAVIAEVADGNAIDDKRLAINSAAGYIDSAERYMESDGNLESIVTGLESALIGIEHCAMAGQNGSALQAMDALRRIREVAAVFLDSSGVRAERGIPASGAAAEPACHVAAAARRAVNPDERCTLCQANNHSETECAWFGNEKTLAFVQQLDKFIIERAAEFNAAPGEALKPSIFDVITGTANLPPKVPQELPSREEHIAQIERVAADLHEHGPDRVQLKPCDFCGGPPVPFVQLASQGFGAAPRLDSYGDDGLSIEAFVSCHECGSRGPIHEDDIFDASDYDSALEAGVDLWQTRDKRHAELYAAGEAEGLNLFPRPDQVSEGGEL